MGDENRESWGNHCEFFLSSLGLAVGLGNVWRFPYVAYTNGGGSFLIPYMLMLFIVGLPAFWVELSIGQYARVGANKVFGRMVPIFKGLGYGMIIVRFFVNVYYVIIQAWSFYYLFAGFTSDLPWAYCDRNWNTENCYTIDLASECNTNGTLEGEFTYWRQNCTHKEDYCKGHEFQGYELINNIDYCANYTNDLEMNLVKEFTTVVEDNGISPAEDYFNGKVLGLNKDYEGNIYTWSDFGSLQWELVGCLALSWVLVCLTLIQGIQSYGKVSYVITLSPYFVLTALLIYAAQLPGAGDGVSYFITPEWDALLDFNIWSAAASQILFSLSIGFGSQLVLSSFNNFKTNTQRDSILISIFNSLTSVYAGFVVFSILGFLQVQTQKPIDKVVTGGISLAFVSYPSAVIEMDVSPLWSFLFFFMLINLAMSSICGGVQTFISFILDEVPAWNKWRTWIVIGLCVMFFFMGLPFLAAGGIHLFTVFDDRCTKSLLLITFLEVVCVTWIYGVNNFLDNIEEMGMSLPTPVKWIWRILLVVVTPIVLITVTILSWIGREPLSYAGYEYPGAVQGMAWFLEMFPVAVVLAYPAWTIYVYKEKKGYSGKELFVKLINPTESWFNTDRGLGDNTNLIGNEDSISRKSNDSSSSRGSIRSDTKKTAL